MEFLYSKNNKSPVQYRTQAPWFMWIIHVIIDVHIY